MSVLQFGAFTLDPARAAVLRDGVEVELRTQSFAVLRHLASNPGRVVSKDELFDAIWHDAEVTPDSLVQCITEIRKALGDTDQPIIKTIRGKGYRFVAEISPVQPAAQTVVHEPDRNPPRDPSPPTAPPQSIWQAPFIALGLLIAVLAGGSGWLLWNYMRSQPPAMLTMMAAPSIIVLPVKTLGDDADSALSSLADEIATGVWRAPRGFNPDLRPSNAAKDAPHDPKAIGRNLRVRYIVLPSARRESGTIYINVQLIEAEATRQLWVGTFHYDPGQPGAQERAAARIGRTLAAELLQIEARRPLPARPEAGHFVILGRALMNSQRSARTNAEAIAFFEKAMSLEPENFLALVQFARATADHVLNRWAPKNEWDERLATAETAIKLAIKLQPTSAGAHLTRGGVLRARREYEQAIAAFQEALLHNPNFANAHAEWGRTLIDMGRPEETAQHVKNALTLSPTDFARYIWCYWAELAELYADHPKAALEWLRISHEANEAHDNTLWLTAVALAHDKRETEARTMMDKFLKLTPNATIEDWTTSEPEVHQAIAEPRARILATMKRLGIPEGKIEAASKP